MKKQSKNLRVGDKIVDLELNNLNSQHFEVVKIDKISDTLYLKYIGDGDCDYEPNDEGLYEFSIIDSEPWTLL